MKKISPLSLATALLVAVFWLLSAAFALGTNVAPESYWLPTPMKAEGTNNTMNAGVTVDLDRYLPAGNGEKEVCDVSRIYVFIGRAYTKDPEGNVTVNFDFKTTSEASDAYVRRVTATVPATYGNARYTYYKVFDASETGDPVGFKRVKINTAYSFEFFEVVFTDERGRAFSVENAVVDETAYGDHETRFGSALTDEQDTFRLPGSGAFVLSERECDELAAVDSFLTGSGYAAGSAPLRTLLDSFGVACFGRNAFGIRFSSFLFGYFALLAAAWLARRLFLKRKVAVCVLLLALAGGSLFVASAFTSAAVYAAFFLLLALSLSVGFFADRYSFRDVRASVSNVCLTGLFFGLSVACAPQTVFFLAAIAAVYAVALRRRYIEYKAEEKAAVGLAKEDAYQSYRRSAIGAAWSCLVGYVLLPVLVLLLTFAVTSVNDGKYFGLPFFASAAKVFGGAFRPSYAFNPLLFFVGFGTESAGAGQVFFNKVVSLCSLAGFLSASFVVFFGGRKKGLSEKRRKIFNKYRVLTFAFVASLLPCLFGMGTGVADYALSSVLYAAYVPLALTAFLGEGRRADGVLYGVVALSLVVFAAGYCGYAAFGLPEVLRKVLYGWQAV